jgi:hypothetical protein
MNWIELFREKYQSFELEEIITKPGMLNIEHFISIEIIEKLIDEIPDATYSDEPFTIMNGDELKERLRDKWLNQ